MAATQDNETSMISRYALGSLVLMLCVGTGCAAPGPSNPNKITRDDCEIKTKMGFEYEDNGWGGLKGRARVFSGSIDGWDFKPSNMHYNFYGNWCGPNHPKAHITPEPLDKLDMACKAHDLCYEYNGYLSCGCDKTLVETLRQAIERNEHLVECKRNGEWTKEPNISYHLILAYFEGSLKKCKP